MKMTKRILCIVLTFTMGLALLIPTAATTPTDPNAPIITKQPKTSQIVIRDGKDVKLEVEACLPDGVEGTLSYAWYDYDWQPGDTTTPVATGAKTTVRAVCPFEKAMNEQRWDIIIGVGGLDLPAVPYCVVVTNTYTEGGVEKTAYTKSENMDVTIYPGVALMFKLSLIPFKPVYDMVGFPGVVLGVAMSMFYWITSPVLFLMFFYLSLKYPQ